MFKSCKSERAKIQKVSTFIKTIQNIDFDDDLSKYDTEEKLWKELDFITRCLHHLIEAEIILKTYNNKKVDEYKKQRLKEKQLQQLKIQKKNPKKKQKY